MQNEKLVIEIQMGFEKKILNGIEDIEPINVENVKQLLDTTKENATSEVRSMALTQCGSFLSNLLF